MFSYGTIQSDPAIHPYIRLLCIVFRRAMIILRALTEIANSQRSMFRRLVLHEASASRRVLLFESR
jgi:hypothetical protein